MARRPPGPKATPTARATAAPKVSAASKAPKAAAQRKPPRAVQPEPAARLGPSAQPEATAQPRPAAEPEPTAQPRPAAQPKPAARPAPATQPEPAAGRPIGLRVAAAALALEAVGLAVAAVFAVISTVDGRAYQLGGGIAAALIALATASGLAGISRYVATARPWTRVPTALTQLFVIIAGITLLQGHRPEWGVPALALAVTGLAGLLTPASLRALNRPPIKYAKDE